MTRGRGVGTLRHQAGLGGNPTRAAASARGARVRCSATALPNPKKVVLAYSGGLDTSVILKWLQNTYGCEVITFTADLGQGEELEPARAKAESLGIKQIYIDDVREQFVSEYVFPMFRANAVYEGIYLLGTSIARPLIAKRQIEIALETGADAVCHGATGKGNDQVRFELGYYALKPDIRVISPWREWDLNSRTKLISYAEENGIDVPTNKRGEAPFSMDANLLHISYEGNALEDPWIAPTEDMFTRSVSPEAAPDTPTVIEMEFERGDPVAIDGVRLSPAALLTRLNELGGENGIGRIDIVESRFVGMKSRGVYETPGGTILLEAHRAIESICLDRGQMVSEGEEAGESGGEPAHIEPCAFRRCGVLGLARIGSCASDAGLTPFLPSPPLPSIPSSLPSPVPSLSLPSLPFPSHPSLPCLSLLPSLLLSFPFLTFPLFSLPFLSLSHGSTSRTN